jgi:hypothetical protein
MSRCVMSVVHDGGCIGDLHGNGVGARSSGRVVTLQQATLVRHPRFRRNASFQRGSSYATDSSRDSLPDPGVEDKNDALCARVDSEELVSDNISVAIQENGTPFGDKNSIRKGVFEVQQQCLSTHYLGLCVEIIGQLREDFRIVRYAERSPILPEPENESGGDGIENDHADGNRPGAGRNEL